jgi:thiol-disulfide isomerase/thioredoxin
MKGTEMKYKFFSIIAAAVFAIILAGASSIHAQQDAPIPSYGAGPIEVRMYSDYFCPPCQKLEPALEPVLKKLARKKNIRLTFVDVPIHTESPLYARYFLYALKSRNSAEYGIYVRSVLFQAAEGGQNNSREKIEGLLAGRNIRFTAFNPKPVFERYNALISEDKIDTTPTCVIVRNGKKDKFTGAAIVNALEGLI